MGSPVPVGFLEANFDIAVRNSCSVAVSYGEGQTALLATKLAVHLGLQNHHHGHQESKLHLGLDHRAYIRDISYVLGSFPRWEAIRIPRHANQRAHIAAKWAASHK